ncbi:MAG: selenocysteine-specific translation elongation factor [Pseudomonadota bacterium]|nr:selenocysteine-specific translation elongation factor [Pseudomonadota bacterium]
MIIGTAGHIDHGKTTLVRALTGVDTDRLPEEKKRGISIELGYAYLDTPHGPRIGFIDVPGHERLVHTMIAGASGIDFALLLIAADDGPKPQTLEHLAVLSLLGVSRGAVALTKADRVDAARLEALRNETAALLADTPLQQAPVFAVSAQTGLGIDALRTHLTTVASTPVADADASSPARAFRLAVDRGFTLDGSGTVVTGTIHAGRVQVGDDLLLLPARTRARVRSLHAQNRAVASAHAGQRCALALAGVPRDAVQRGQWVVAPPADVMTSRLDATLTLWHAEPRALRSGAPVHVHIGAASVQGTVAVLDADTLPPGATALVQLVLHQPVGAWHGDRVLLRDASASRTMAGGMVLDPFAPARYRRTPQRMAELAALAHPTPAERLAACIAVATHGTDLTRFAAAQGLAAHMHGDALPPGTLLGGDQALGAHQAQAVAEAALAALTAFHERQPNELGPDVARLRRLSAPRLPAALWQALLTQMAQEGRVSLQGACVHLPQHGAQLSATEERIAQKTAVPLLHAGFEGAWARDLAREASEPEALVRTTLARLARRGELHAVVKDLYYAPATMHELASRARAVASEHAGQVLAAQFRDATGLGRKRAIQILEYFDRVGLTRRVGDVHKLRSECTLFLP